MRFMEASLCAVFVCSLCLRCLDHAGRRGARQADTGLGGHADTFRSAHFPQNGTVSQSIATADPEGLPAAPA
jgi:hypothetical protein